MDDTHLIGKYFDTLFVACACDKQNHVFPVVYVVVELENKDGRSCFLLQLWEAVMDLETLLLALIGKKVLPKPYHLYYQKRTVILFGT